jgi:hypothetical protein
VGGGGGGILSSLERGEARRGVRYRRTSGARGTEIKTTEGGSRVQEKERIRGQRGPREKY